MHNHVIHVRRGRITPETLTVENSVTDDLTFTLMTGSEITHVFGDNTFLRVTLRGNDDAAECEADEDQAEPEPAYRAHDAHGWTRDGALYRCEGWPRG